MRFEVASSGAASLLWLIAGVEASKHGHLHRSGHQHGRQHGGIHSVAEVGAPLQKRGGSCQFPSDAGLVAVTPSASNGGWAMSPDQPCQPGGYCPYACPPGQVSMQWDPEATSYSYPISMNGGLYCDENGQIQKPFPDKPYCQDGVGSVKAINKASQQVAFCQTVLPGNEAMLIPTLVEELVTLAVPDTSYWCETAAHYYINPPGYDTDTACVWGTSENPYGNWSPYVAGANTDGSGNTFLKIGWNPIYLELTTPFRDVVPEFGVEIVCEGNNCNGLPCKIDPDVNGVNEMTGDSSVGAGGATFCVVTVPPGESANVIVFEKSGSGSDSSPSTTAAASSSSSNTSASSSSTSTTTSSSATSTLAPSSSTSEASASGATISISAAFSWGAPSASGSAYSNWEASGYMPHIFVEETASLQAQAAQATGEASQSTAAAASASHEGSAANIAVSMLTLGMGAFAAIAMNL